MEFEMKDILKAYGLKQRPTAKELAQDCQLLSYNALIEEILNICFARLQLHSEFSHGILGLIEKIKDTLAFKSFRHENNYASVKWREVVFPRTVEVLEKLGFEVTITYGKYGRMTVKNPFVNAPAETPQED
ncbi:MAG: hypothetical protein EBR79_01765 [Proteobacteria bacterium]|nr:hypothetical protein [Pseudomonadota bacterium]